MCECVLTLTEQQQQQVKQEVYIEGTMSQLVLVLLAHRHKTTAASL